MSDRSFPVVRYVILFAACYGSYKAVNIIDACVRSYLVKRYHVYVEDYPTVSLEKFFGDDDWD